MGTKVGFLARIDGNDLVITLDQEFLETCGVGKWGEVFRQRYPGPFERVVLDLTHLKLVQSTLFAEMLHLRDAYEGAARQGVWLRNPSRRAMAVMEIMQMSQLFVIEQAPPA
jgi:hypothetical protein